VTIRSRSTKTVDLVCEVMYQSLGNGVTSGLGRVLWIFDWKNPDTRRVVGSREAHSHRSHRRHDFGVGDFQRERNDCSLFSQVLKAEDSCEQVARTHSVRGVNRGDRWHAPSRFGWIQPSLTYCVSGICKVRA
jgi:hypothetical protein